MDKTDPPLRTEIGDATPYQPFHRQDRQRQRWQQRDAEIDCDQGSRSREVSHFEPRRDDPFEAVARAIEQLSDAGSWLHRDQRHVDQLRHVVDSVFGQRPLRRSHRDKRIIH